MSLFETWKQIKSNIVDKNSHNSVLTGYFSTAELSHTEDTPEGTVFHISVPTELHQYWISQHLIDTISSEISATYGRPFSIQLTVKKRDLPEPHSFNDIAANTPPSEVIQSQSPVSRSNHSRHHLNPDYTFSTFVVGRNTEFAHAVSYNIANNPGAENYNPLFICGPTGMGKTHLLNAVGNHIRAKFPNTRICYCTAETFLNDFITSVRRAETAKFREKYRHGCDILLMDDIQLLAKGEAVQEEFFHTLNDFFQKGQQVIVASDRMPKDIMGLEDRIRTRLEWGLVADIQMPDFETRVAILKYKSETMKINIPHDVINYIARISKTSVRKLEGNLKLLKMLSELQQSPINLDMAIKALSAHDDTQTLTIEEIQKLVADHYKIRIADLKGKSRAQPLTVARHTSMFFAKKYLDVSLVDIGREFGGRDHTTIINAIQRVEIQLSTNPEFKKDFNEIETRIHNLTGV